MNKNNWNDLKSFIQQYMKVVNTSADGNFDDGETALEKVLSKMEEIEANR